MAGITKRLTHYATGGGCACKIPPGELEDVLAGLGVAAPANAPGELVVGLESGDDAAVVRVAGDNAVVSTVDFFTPVVDDPFDWGRIAAANALSDVYAMGGRPVVAVNLLCWPRDVLPYDVAVEVLRGGAQVAAQAGCHVAGGHSVDDPQPKYGLAVTGLADPDRLLRSDAGRPGMPLSLTKPLGLGVLNNRHKATGEVFPEAIATMTRLNDEASGRRARRGHPLRHRRHRLRPARPRLQARPRLRRHRGHRRRGRALPRGRPRGGARRLRPGRHPPQPRLGRPR